MNEQAIAAEPDTLTLKWGTLKGWHVHSEEALNILSKYHALGASMSAMMQQDTPEQKDLICQLIDVVNTDTIYLDWDGKDVSKEEAKEYVRNYGKK